jgi:hypothetical protein
MTSQKIKVQGSKGVLFENGATLDRCGSGSGGGDARVGRSCIKATRVVNRGRWYVVVVCRMLLVYLLGDSVLELRVIDPMHTHTHLLRSFAYQPFGTFADLGFGDLGYTGSSIKTPVIDGLAKSGVILVGDELH